LSIRYRLILSYIAMICVPILLFIVAVLLMMLLFMGDIREVSDLLPASHQMDKTKLPDQRLLLELKKKSVVAPEQLVDSDFLDSLNRKVTELDAFILVRQNQQIIYSSEETKHLAVSELPQFGGLLSDNSIEKFGDKTYSIKQQDFYLPDGSEASVFILRDASPMVKLMRTFFPLMLGMLIVILILTNGLLTYYVSRSIIKPINRLKEAAEKIGQGQLDSRLLVTGKDEISQLTRTFEQMREQLKHSTDIQRQYEENRKELIAHISHDLKTPITTIKGYVEGIRDGVANTDEKRERYLQTIYQKSIDLDRLIDELFLYSKLDLKKVSFHFIEMDLKNYLMDFAEELAFELENRSIKLRFVYDDAENYIMMADPEKLRRVFTNIIENSLKYMDKENGEIHVSLRKTSEDIRISISDNGSGISQEALPYIFDQFYRAEQSRNKQTGGSGLGLSIAKMVIEAHGGTILAESEKGIGTRLTVVLPQ
jgi:histidine kinase